MSNFSSRPDGWPPRIYEICPCGHPIHEHGIQRCMVGNNTCNCRHARPLFAVTNYTSFLGPHYSAGIGHALMQGVLTHPEGLDGISLSSRDLGKNPECYRCMLPTTVLMPILVNRNSVKAVTDLSRARMTRLWCEGCCELEEIEFIPYVAYAINLAWNRRHRRST